MNLFEAAKKRVGAVRLADEVSRILVEEITRGALRPGEQLPTEKMLGEQFGVSRSVIREAVSRLKFDGLIETKQGKGAFVSRSRPSFRIAPELVVRREELRQIFELRMYVEAAAAELAAARCTRADLAAMRAALAGMAKAIKNGEDGVDADISFHMAVAAASKNDYFESFTKFLGDNLRESIRTARLNSARYPGRPALVQGEHEAMFRAIEQKNPAAARQAAQTHLRNAALRLALVDKK